MQLLASVKKFERGEQAGQVIRQPPSHLPGEEDVGVVVVVMPMMATLAPLTGSVTREYCWNLPAKDGSLEESMLQLVTVVLRRPMKVARLGSP